MSPQSLVIVLTLITVFLNTVAQLFLKLGAAQKSLNLFIVSGLLAYGLSTLFYIMVLEKFNLSMVYPLIIGLTIAATTFTGVFFLGEKVATLHWLGIGLVLSGISAITLSKAYSAH
jgi:small multidrug resistance pump